MGKRVITEIVKEYDSKGNLIRKTKTITEEDIVESSWYPWSPITYTGDPPVPFDFTTTTTCDCKSQC